jgi:hypothetical protein
MLTYIDPKEIHQRKDVDLLTRYMKSCFYERGKQA